MSSLDWPRGYELECFVGAGGVAEVYRGRLSGAKGFAKTVAIKKVRADLVRHRKLTDTFRAEALLARTLHHGNIVQIFDLGEKEGSPFLVMEYVDGVSLAQLLADLGARQEKLAIGETLYIVEQTGAALAYAHRPRDSAPLGVVHRDVSPGNILLSCEGVVKLSDFGLARAIADPSSTLPGTVKGTMAYLSPEQALGKPVDAKSDQFSLGVILYQLLAGQNPLAEARELETVQRLFCEGLPPLPVGGEVDGELAGIVKQATAIDPAKRFATVDQLVAALEGWRAGKGHRGSPAAVAEVVQAARRQNPRPPVRRIDEALDAVMLARQHQTRAERSTRAPQRRRSRATFVRRFALLAAAMVGAGASLLAVARNKSASIDDPWQRGERAGPGPAAAGGFESGRAKGLAAPTRAAASPGGAAAGARAPRPSWEAANRVEPRPPQPGGQGAGLANPASRSRTGLRRRASERAALGPPATSAAAMAIAGQLKVNLIPYAEVIVDGKSAGFTPIALSIAAGPHTLTLINPKTEQRRSIELVIEAGETVSVTVWPP